MGRIGVGGMGDDLVMKGVYVMCGVWNFVEDKMELLGILSRGVI